MRFGPLEISTPRHWPGRPLDPRWGQLEAALPSDWTSHLDRVRDAAEATYKVRALSEHWAGWTPDTSPVSPWREIACDFAAALIRVFGEQLSAHINDPRQFDYYLQFGVGVAVEEAWTMCVYDNEGIGVFEKDLKARKADFGRLVERLNETAIKEFRVVAWRRFRDAHPESNGCDKAATPPQAIALDGALAPTALKARHTVTVIPKRKRGPKPDYDESCRVRDAIRDVCGDNWKTIWRKPGSIDIVADALDEIQAVRPRTWAKRKPPLRTWNEALEQEKPIFVKAVDARLEHAAQISLQSDRDDATPEEV